MWQGGSNSDPRRRAARYQPETVQCPLGDVVDLSRVGARIACKGKPPLRVGQTGSIRLRGPDGSVNVEARAVWMKRIGLRKHLIGIAFINVKPTVSEALDALAKFGFFSAVCEGSQRSGRRNSTRISATADLPNYYAVLGVAPTATDEEIRTAYRALARRYHPDVCKEDNATARFAEIQNAYAVLIDKEQRRAYDMRVAA